LFAKCLQFELNSVQQVADRNNDVQLVDFVESEFLAEQVCIAFMLAYFHSYGRPTEFGFWPF